MNNRGMIPPMTMPTVIGLIDGSIRDATNSAITWALAASIMPAI